MGDQWDLQESIHAFERLILADPGPSDSTIPNLIDLEELRALCQDGVPDFPAQIRPLVWEVTMGVLPLDKAQWRSSRRKSRQEYYTHLETVQAQVIDGQLDKLIQLVTADVDRLCKSFPFLRHTTRPSRSSRLHPSHSTQPDSGSDSDSLCGSAAKGKGRAREGISETLRRAIPDRIAAINNQPDSPTHPPPRITLSVEPSSPVVDSGDSAATGGAGSGASRTLHAPKNGSSEAVHAVRDTHADALTRILVLACATRTYEAGFTSLLRPLYLLFAQMTTPRPPSTYGEEETYSFFLRMLDSMDRVWSDTTALLSTLGERLKWADEHLYCVLQQTDLTPESPVYSFRWIQSLLADDIADEDLIPFWDVIFSSRDPVAALLDMCCALILASKKHLSRGKVKKGMWGEISRSEELDFVRIVDFFRNVPLPQIGGVPAVLGAYTALQEAPLVIPPKREPTPVSTDNEPKRNSAIKPFSFKPKPKPEPAPAQAIPLADRLAKLVTTTQPAHSSPPPPPPRQVVMSPPKPLLLQDKARRASGGYHSPSSRPTSLTSSPSMESVIAASPAVRPRPMGARPLLADGSAPQRVIDFDQSVFAVGLMTLSAVRRRPPRRLWSAFGALAQRYKSNYAGHVPLNQAQNALLAVGSGVVGVLDTTRGDLIATLSESTASTFLPTLHARMVAHPEGRQIMRDRPIVSSQTVDLGRLASLKRGTLGREYVEWLRRGDLTPDSREPVRYIDSPTLAYTMLRYRQTHDLYHTLFSLPPTLPHELSLKVVELSNMSLPVAGLSSLFGPFRLTNARRALWLQDWAPWALRVGQEGKSLVGVYWEKRWEQGVGELRRELGVYRNDAQGVEGRWKGYREVREMEREFRRKREWVDEPESW